MSQASADVTLPDRELTEEERRHMGLPLVDSVATVEVVHPDRELTPEERAHLGLS